MISTNDVKPGMALQLSDGLFTIVEYQHVKPGKGRAFVRMKLKNLETGQVLDRTFRADENVDQAIIERRDHQYLYRDDLGFHFMNLEDFGQSRSVETTSEPLPVTWSREHRKSLPLSRDTYRCGDAGRRGARSHLRRARGQRRHQDRRHQAGHATDRDSDPGPPVRRAGGSSQSRHAVRGVPHQNMSQEEPRDLALQALYQADIAGDSSDLGELSGRVGVLVHGVLEHKEELDNEIESASEHWSVARMPVIDRSILRLGLYELRHVTDTPTAVVVSEAVRLAKTYSTERSGAFVNGVLLARWHVLP